MNDPIKDDSENEVFSNGGGGAAGAGLVAAEEDDSNSSDADSDVSDQEGVPAGYQALPQEPSQQHTQDFDSEDESTNTTPSVTSFLPPPDDTEARRQRQIEELHLWASEGH